MNWIDHTPRPRLNTNERDSAILAYVVALVPFLGVFFDMLISRKFMNRNRLVVFHATQAIYLHVALLIVYTIGFILMFVLRWLSVFDPEIAEQFYRWSTRFVAIGYMCYGLACFTAAFALVFGHDHFQFPVVGSRLSGPTNPSASTGATPNPDHP